MMIFGTFPCFANTAKRDTVSVRLCITIREKHNNLPLEPLVFYDSIFILEIIYLGCQQFH